VVRTTTLAIPLIRVFRAVRGETFDEARGRRPELVTLDTSDLLVVATRCQTSFSRREVEALHAAAESIPEGAMADLLLAPGGRVQLALHDRHRLAPSTTGVHGEALAT
jgi:hypothetical protein